MKTKSEKKRLLQGVVPRGARTQNVSLSGASKSPFGAKAPAEELERWIDKHLREARRCKWVYRYAAVPSKDAAAYWQGYAAALVNLRELLKAQPGKQALARNSDYATGGSLPL